MNSTPIAPGERPWPWHRWSWFIGLAFAAHVGLIFAFGNRRPIVPRAIVNAPAVQFTTHWNEQQQLNDPTLFALPHPKGFAGAAWLRQPRIEFAPFHWSEPPRLLALSGTQLGTTFRQHRETNRFAQLELEVLPRPKLTETKPAPATFIADRRSKASLTSELASRRWLNAPANLPAWSAADLLTNSVVQVWVQADGQILSPVLLLPGSGSKEADQLALKLARTARFLPVSSTTAKLTHGALIFEWQTVPTTNAIPTSP